MTNPTAVPQPRPVKVGFDVALLMMLIRKPPTAQKIVHSKVINVRIPRMLIEKDDSMIRKQVTSSHRIRLAQMP